jgi:hypothetical protein
VCAKSEETGLHLGEPHATIITRRRWKGDSIFTSVRSTAVHGFDTGTIPGAGTFYCLDCGSHLSLLENDVLPECPDCGATSFGRDSIFGPLQEQPTEQTSEFPAAEDSPPDWLPEARSMLPGAGRFLASRDDNGKIDIYAIAEGWTRIGRSVAADYRLDDPSVSRRHALIVSEEPKALRVLDDRSLNGVRLNGELIEWGRLVDGDELTVGRYRLFVLEA